MVEIEDLSLTLLQSPIFQSLLRQQVRQYARQYSQLQSNTSQLQRLPQLVHQINTYITEITQLALEEENSHNYITFLNKTEEMCRELEKKMEGKLNQAVEGINEVVQQLANSVKEQSKRQRKIGSESSKLNNQRKMITQSILEGSRFQTMNKTKSSINPRILNNSKAKSIITVDHCYDNDQELMDTQDCPSSLEVDSSLKWVEIEHQNKRIIGEVWAKMEIALDRLKRQFQELRRSEGEVKDKIEAKMQANFEGVWNVLSDLSTRIVKFQALQSVIAVCSN